MLFSNMKYLMTLKGFLNVVQEKTQSCDHFGQLLSIRPIFRLNKMSELQISLNFGPKNPYISFLLFSVLEF